MRLLKRHVSLSTKYAGLLVVVFLLPTSVYFIFDILFVREALLRLQVDALQRTAAAIASQLDPDTPDFPAGAQAVLLRYAAHNTDLDVLIIDRNLNVVAATLPVHRGKRWREVGIQEVLNGETPSTWTIMQHDGADVLDVTVPVVNHLGRVILAVHMARALPTVEAEMRDIKWRHGLFFFITGALAIIILSIGTYWLVLRRLRILDAALRNPGPKRALPRAVGQPDELDTLANVLSGLVDELHASALQLKKALAEKDSYLAQTRGFNEQLEKEVAKVRDELIAAQQTLIHAEHFSTIGQLAAGLAHEVRNPLFIIRGYAARLAKKGGDYQETCNDIIKEVERVNRIIKRLLEIGQPTTIEIHDADLCDTLDRVVNRARQGLDSSRDVNLQLKCQDGLRVRADPHLLRQAVANILDNALNAVGAQGTVTVEAIVREKRVVVSIVDNGPGIAKNDLEHIFEPFFSRSPGGTGLGLCAAKKVLDLHGAEIQFASELGQGTTVQIYLNVAVPHEIVGVDKIG